MLNPVHVAVAVVREGDRVLIARRPAHKHQGGLLEFPGGKVESGEPVCEALARELAEEIGIIADPTRMQPLIRIKHDYGDKCVLLDVWEVPGYTGTPKGLEGQPVQWLPISALRQKDFPAANRAIIRALQLPNQWLITGHCPDAATLRRQLEGSRPGSGFRGVLLRQPGLGLDEYRQMAAVALEYCSGRGLPLMLHNRPELLSQFPAAAGVHLSQAVLAEHDSANLLSELQASGQWLGVSCHTPEELTRASQVGADYAFLSPVRPTASHPDQPELGWERFGTWVANVPLPVYALGGVSAEDIPLSRRHGGQGIAGISHWWPRD